jgi:8-oxo-dGTP pyrophosphatase MutT (NUDIX family)
MTSPVSRSTASDGRIFRLSRAGIAARLARPVPPRPDDRHIAALPAGARITHAAVLVPLIPRGDDVTVLLTQRTAHLHDHPSQISFPGGRVEGSDESRVETALREAEEEIGLTRERIEVIGNLTDYEIPSGFRISPVVGWVEPPFELKLDPFEVTAAFEVPLSFVLDPANHQRRSYHFNGRHRDYLAMPYQGRYIWGATAGILYSLYLQLTDDLSCR